jgi:signal transduction histidine kinase
MAAPRVDLAEQARLRQIVWFDVATSFAAVTLISLTYVVIEPSRWLLVLSVTVALSGMAMAATLRPLNQGDLGRTVLGLALANWFVALAASSIAVFAWPLMVLAALLPTLIAAPYIAGPHIRGYVATSLVVAVLVSALGLLQDFSGFEDELPEWTTVGIVLLFTPVLAGILLVTALQHSSRLQSLLSETLAGNRALAASRARVVAAADRERRRVERDLHDGAQHHLIALRLHLRRAEVRCRVDPDAMPEVFAGLREDVAAAHDELRDLARGVYPPVLTDHGLGEALLEAAHRCPLPVDVELQATGSMRCDPTVEATVYFCCVEALQNATKHAGPASVRLGLEVDATEVRFAVVDDGVGFDPDEVPATGGLESLRDRVSAVGGSLEIAAAPWAGSTVTGRIPLDPR